MVKYWHFCLLSATSCLLLSTDNLDATVLSSIPSESSKHHSHIHTLSHLDLSRFSPYLFLKQSGYQSYRMASVCFITDAGNCSGQEFSNLETPDGTNRPDYDTIPEQCRDAGYTKTSCPAGQHLVNPCPSDNRYYERCECNENLTEICNIPYYGVGSSCDGKYEKCERDDDRACKEEGYPLTGSCPTLQVPNRRCPYDSNYYDKCVCQSGLISCPSPQIGVGPSCGGKYQSCQCPSNYKSCDCGPAVGASSCTINGKTTYSDCKACCDDTCPSGYSKTNPGGCYDTRTTGCGNTCYKSKSCCSSSYRFTCTGSHEIPPDDELSCEGKYPKCRCDSSSLTWNINYERCLALGHHEVYISSGKDLFTNNGKTIYTYSGLPMRCTACPEKQLSSSTVVVTTVGGFDEAKEFINNWSAKWFTTNESCSSECL